MLKKIMGDLTSQSSHDFLYHGMSFLSGISTTLNPVTECFKFTQMGSLDLYEWS